MASKEEKTREYIHEKKRREMSNNPCARTTHKNHSHAPLSHPIITRPIATHHHLIHILSSLNVLSTATTPRQLIGGLLQLIQHLPPPAPPAPTLSFPPTPPAILSSSPPCHAVSSPAASGPRLKSTATNRGRCTSKTARSTSAAARAAATPPSSSAVGPRPRSLSSCPVSYPPPPPPLAPSDIEARAQPPSRRSSRSSPPTPTSGATTRLCPVQSRCPDNTTIATSISRSPYLCRRRRRRRHLLHLRPHRLRHK
jgi:hypothetical protein